MTARSARGAEGPPAAEELDRQWTELVEELRLAIPGAEVLFGFLLVLPFQAEFATLSGFQRILYFSSLLSTSIATVLLISPSVNHRLRWRHGDKERLLKHATRMSIVATLFVAGAMIGTVFLISDLLFGQPVAGVAVGALVGMFGWFWYGLPLRMRD